MPEKIKEHPSLCLDSDNGLDSVEVHRISKALNRIDTDYSLVAEVTKVILAMRCCGNCSKRRTYDCPIKREQMIDPSFGHMCDEWKWGGPC